MMKVSQHPIPSELIEYVESNRDKLTSDVSNYAKGRERAWIGLEAPLSDKQGFKPAPFGYDSRLWIWLEKFCIAKLNFKPEVALLHVGGADCSDPEDHPEDGTGGQCGIQEHRDASYADYRAVGINLCGTATFAYRWEYPHMDRWSKDRNNPAQLIHVPMVTGTCVQFNCKNPHFASVGPGRWCINAWTTSSKRRNDYLAAR